MQDFDIEKKHIIEGSPLSIYLMDSAGYFKFVNQQMLNLSGYTKQELVGSHFTILVYSEDRQMVRDAVQKRLEQAEVTNSYEFRGIKKNGEVVNILGFFNLIDVDGENCILGQVLDITAMKNLQEELSEKEARYRTIMEHSNVGYFEVDLSGNFTYFNDVVPHNLGYAREELMGMNNREFTDNENAQKVYSAFNKVYRTGQTQKFFDWELIHRNGMKTHVETSVLLMKDREGNPSGFRGIVNDVTERKRYEQSLRESEFWYRAIFEGSGTAMAIIDDDNTITMVNKKLQEMSGYSKNELENNLDWKELVDSKDADKVTQYHNQLKQDNHLLPIQYEFILVDKYGVKKDVLANMNLVPETRKCVVSMQDVTQRKKIEEDLKHLSFYDVMTGLYNRNYFDQELDRYKDGRRSPIGIIVCDVDGLKHVNDTKGHKWGDQLINTAASVIQGSLRESDMVARIGGDEFGILLPKSEKRAVLKVIERIKSAVEEYNAQNPESELSISTGYAVGKGPRIDVNQLFTRADNNMYHNKFRSYENARSDTVRVIRKILELSEITSEKEQREIQELAENFADYLELSETEANELILLAQFHEIGKIGVWDHILFKEDFLDTKEFEEIIKHCNNGYQIAQKAHDLESIADYILTHHERYDGSGYPWGLKKDEIPLLCRIISILETFCAMTNPRPYRNATTWEKAVLELKDNAGTQFDPELVAKFITMIENLEDGLDQAHAPNLDPG